MSEPEHTLSRIDRMIHEPARLAILCVLSACHDADFLFLQRSTGLTSGNLSVQLTKLEEAGLLHIEKTFKQKKTLTTATLTPLGRAEMERYWKTMDALRVREYPALM